MGNLVKTPHSEVNSTLEVLDRFGVTADHLARLRAEPDYAKRVAECMLRDGLEGSIHHKLARAVMGQNFFGVEDWATFYGASFTKKQLRQVAEFPWGEDVLNGPCPFVTGKTIRETHFAFLGLHQLKGTPLTVKHWLTVHPKDGQPRFYFAENPWHDGQPHTDEATMELKWYLLLKDIVPNSTSMTPEEQAPLVPQEYDIPTTISEVTKDILVFRKTGVRPNPTRWSACKERTVATALAFAGFVSCVGAFGGHGLYVDYWNGLRDGYVGLGASRKS